MTVLDFSSPATAGPDIDSLLGPGERRYFGSGYRRVLHRLGDFAADPEAGTARGSARLEYPGDWSAKAGSAQRPHLSTIDALVLGVAVCEADLVASGLAPGDRDRAWLRSVTIKAGSSPEEELESVPLTAHRISRRIGTTQAWCTGYTVQVGPMKVRMEVEHGEVGGAPAVGAGPMPAASLFGADHYYLSRYKSHRQEIDNLDVAVADGRIGAEVRVGPDLQAGVAVSPFAAATGVEGFYQPSCSMIDAIVVTAQLAQLYLYGVDGVPRSRSRTMWLREITLQSPTPYQPTSRPFPALIDVVKAPLIPLRGDVYRTCEAAWRVHGLHGRFKIAHALPADHPAALKSDH